MKNYNETIDSVFARINEHEVERRRKRKVIARTAASMCCICIAVLLGFNVWKSELFKAVAPDVSEGDNTGLQGTAKPNETVGAAPDAPIIWGDNNGKVQEMGYTEWNGKRVTLSLYDALSDETNKNRFIAIGVSFELDNEFVYKGKTVAEYDAEAIRKNLISDSLGLLMKVGDELKYGEALYKTGTPDGTKWAKQLYEETVDNIGKEILATYIVNGEFLKDKLESDMENYTDHITSRETYYKAIEAYHKYIADKTCKQLKEQNIRCEVRDCLTVFVTADAFSSLKIENAMFYSLESKNGDGADQSEDSDDKIVSFQCTIIK